MILNNKLQILRDKLKNNDRINLLAISVLDTDDPNYSNVDFSFLDSNRFNVDLRFIKNNDIESIISNFNDSKYDCIINLCDSYVSDLENPGLNILLELEKNGIPFTGSSSKVYDMKKTNLKELEHSPKFITVQEYLDDPNRLNCLKFPLLIKPNSLGGSALIDIDSKVENKAELDKKLDEILKITDDILIQDFIEGRELTALLFRKDSKIICLDPIEVQFNSEIKFKTEQLKFYDYDQFSYKYLDDSDPFVIKLKNVLIDSYIKLELNSYIRYDVRVDLNDNIYIIDVNTYPGIFGKKDCENSSDHIILNSYNYNDFVYDILVEI